MTTLASEPKPVDTPYAGSGEAARRSTIRGALLHRRAGVVRQHRAGAAARDRDDVARGEPRAGDHDHVRGHTG